MKPLTKIDHEGFRMAQSLAEGLLNAKSDYSGAFTPGDRLLTNFQTQKLQKVLEKKYRGPWPPLCFAFRHPVACADPLAAGKRFDLEKQDGTKTFLGNIIRTFPENNVVAVLVPNDIRKPIAEAFQQMADEQVKKLTQGVVKTDAPTTNSTTPTPPVSEMDYGIGYETMLESQEM